MSGPGHEHIATRRQIDEAEEALERGDLVAAHRIVFGFDPEDERVLRDLDRRYGQHAGASAEDWRATT